MAFAEITSNSDVTVANPVAVAFAAARRAVAVWRAERARRLALNDLLHMEPHLLRDLGINAYDVRDALRNRAADHQ